MRFKTRPLITLSLAVLIVSPLKMLRAAEVKTVTAGEFIVDPPTLINLGFEWRIEGDDNRNASVDVSYRKKGETQWKQALPLMRLQHEEIYQGDRMDVISPNMKHAS